MDYIEVRAKTIDDAITEATVRLGITSDMLDYEVVEKGSAGFLGINRKDAIIKARRKEPAAVDDSELIAGNAQKPFESKSDSISVGSQDDSPIVSDNLGHNKESFHESGAERRVVSNIDFPALEVVAKDFLSQVFAAMELEVDISVTSDPEDRMISVDFSGPEMGVLIGKRGQTLDSLQYLTNLAVNKKSDSYVKVKLDTEDYRKRRRETLENLAKNVAYKVKRTKRPVSLEPMNPFERRVIHSTLQNDKYVSTHSEGEEPYRHVVVTLKR